MRARFGVSIVMAVAISAMAVVSARQATDGRGAGRGAPPRPPSSGISGLGPNDQPAVDAAAADRGRKLWAADCINCHGTQARGTASGPNLVRSLVVLHDRFGSDLGPFLKKGHQMQNGAASTTLDDRAIVDLANFLRQRVNDTLRGSPIFTPGDIVTGDAAAGAAFFNGPGRCTECHSVTGNLAGIAGRYDAVTVQQRFLFPTGRGRGRGANAGASPTAVTVTVTPASGPAVSGYSCTWMISRCRCATRQGFPRPSHEDRT